LGCGDSATPGSARELRPETLVYLQHGNPTIGVVLPSSDGILMAGSRITHACKVKTINKSCRFGMRVDRSMRALMIAFPASTQVRTSLPTTGPELKGLPDLNVTHTPGRILEFTRASIVDAGRVIASLRHNRR
jgi:hypothetical protein